MFIYACTSIHNNGTIDLSTMGPMLSIFIVNTGNNDMSCDLMNNSKTALLYTKPCHCTSTSVVVLHVT